jgi:hypothetical protein
MLLMNSAVFAAYGNAALLARGYEIERCQRALLSLAVDALQGVQVAVFASAKYYAADQPDFYWVMLNLVLQEWALRSDEIPDSNSVVWDEREAERKLALLERAESYLAGHGTPVLPRIPMPWIKSDEVALSRKNRQGYARNDAVFLYHVADKLLPHICLEPILADARRREQFLACVGELLAWTFQEMVPPFAKSRRDHGGNTPFEWVFTVSAWCGQLCAHLTRNEAKHLIIAPIWSQDTDSALLMLQSLMRSFMVEAFLKPKEISDELIPLWAEMVDWLLATLEWQRNGKGDHIDREFTSCAFATLFCVATDFSPLICAIGQRWSHLPKFLPILERAIREFGTNTTLYLGVTTFLKKGGIDLLPEPALSWLQDLVVNRKSDQKFWQMNGEDTVELIKIVHSQKEKTLTAQHRKAISLICDILVDNGVRGAGFLQQELLRLA